MPHDKTFKAGKKHMVNPCNDDGILLCTHLCFILFVCADSWKLL